VIAPRGKARSKNWKKDAWALQKHNLGYVSAQSCDIKTGPRTHDERPAIGAFILPYPNVPHSSFQIFQPQIYNRLNTG